MSIGLIIVFGGLLSILEGLGIGATWSRRLFVPGSLAILVISSVIVTFIKCPRCRKPFFMKRAFLWSQSSLFSRRCLNCKLAINAGPFLNREQVEKLQNWLADHDFNQPLPDAGIRCHQCGYQLVGSTQYRCPECGMTYNVARLLREAEIMD